MATVTIKHKLDELKQDLIFSWYCDQKPEISIDRLKSAWQLGYTPSSEPTPCLFQLLISPRALRENPFLAFWSLPALLTCGHITTVFKDSIFKSLSAPFSHGLLFRVCQIILWLPLTRLPVMAFRAYLDNPR